MQEKEYFISSGSVVLNRGSADLFTDVQFSSNSGWELHLPHLQKATAAVFSVLMLFTACVCFLMNFHEGDSVWARPTGPTGSP